MCDTPWQRCVISETHRQPSVAFLARLLIYIHLRPVFISHWPTLKPFLCIGLNIDLRQFDAVYCHNLTCSSVNISCNTSTSIVITVRTYRITFAHLETQHSISFGLWGETGNLRLYIFNYLSPCWGFFFGLLRHIMGMSCFLLLGRREGQAQAVTRDK